MNTFIFVWDRSGKRPPRAMHPLLVSTTRRAIEVRMGTHGPMHTLVPLVVRVNPCRGAHATPLNSRICNSCSKRLNVPGSWPSIHSAARGGGGRSNIFILFHDISSIHSQTAKSYASKILARHQSQQRHPTFLRQCK